MPPMINGAGGCNDGVYLRFTERVGVEVSNLEVPCLGRF
jgi:hypothetical protein